MFEVLEKTAGSPVVDADSLQNRTALIVDAISVVQAMKGKWRTFGEFADTLFSFLLSRESVLMMRAPAKYIVTV